MDEILAEFIDEAQNLFLEMTQILEEVEENPSLYQKLEQFGLLVDRIMGGSKTIALECPPEHPIHTVALYSQICKLVSYKGSQISNNSSLVQVVTALLLDATEILVKLTEKMKRPDQTNVNQLFTKTFLERLNWVAAKFDESLRSTVATSSTNTTNNAASAKIDELLKKMGLGG